MPYGIKTGPEIFHKRYAEIFEDIPNVQIYIDDIVVWSKNMQKHLETLKMIFARIRKLNIKLNKNKCKIAQDKVKFLGYIFSSAGVGIDPDKVKAILKITKPRDVKELGRFLGMVTYVAKFVPGLINLTDPLRQLMKKSETFDWRVEHDKAFDSVKK